MSEPHGSVISRFGEIGSYIVSAVMTAGGLLDYLNQYAAAFGILLGIVTLIMNWYYKAILTNAQIKALNDE